jgi:DNA-binding MarR family transcriptional regulator
MVSKDKINNLIELLQGIGKGVHDLHRNTFQGNLSPVAFHSLKFVAENNNPTMKELSDHLGITPPSTTAAIEPLVKNKYLLRNLDCGDRRVIRLSISKKGRQALKESMQQAKKTALFILEQMEEKEVDGLYAGLNHLLNIIKKQYEKNK